MWPWLALSIALHLAVFAAFSSRALPSPSAGGPVPLSTLHVTLYSTPEGDAAPQDDQMTPLPPVPEATAPTTPVEPSPPESPSAAPPPAPEPVPVPDTEVAPPIDPLPPVNAAAAIPPAPPSQSPPEEVSPTDPALPPPPLAPTPRPMTTTQIGQMLQQRLAPLLSIRGVSVVSAGTPLEDVGPGYYFRAKVHATGRIVQLEPMRPIMDPRAAAIARSGAARLRLNPAQADEDGWVYVLLPLG